MDLCVRDALLWNKEEDLKTRCALCAHRCLIGDGHRGICGVRENRGGVLNTLVYGRLVAEHTDPIEKKPLYHFLPGTLSHSIATAGCNFRCAHCQNYSISQMVRDEQAIAGEYSSPSDLVARALRAGASSISYTYTEPTIFLEYALDVMRLAHEKGLGNVFVSNGYMTPEAAQLVRGLLDAANINLKAMSGDFYRKICGARVEPVLETIESLWKMGVWVEVTTLIIPGRNDSEDELRSIARFIKSISPDMPWHVTGFYPTYKLNDAPPTPHATLGRARAIGIEEGLRYVYQGNRPGTGGETTLCPSCGAEVLKRAGFRVESIKLGKGSACPKCGAAIAGRFSFPQEAE